MGWDGALDGPRMLDWDMIPRRKVRRGKRRTLEQSWFSLSAERGRHNRH